MAIWSKVFSRINWQNKPSTTTPINATNLNSSDYALDTIDDRVLELNSRLNNVEPALADLSEAVEQAHKWAQWTDGTNPSATDNAKAWAGQSQSHASSSASSALDSADSADDSADSAEDSEAWAIGERGGVPVGSSDATYHNNSKYFAVLAEEILQGGIPDGTTISFYVSNGHMFVQQTIDGVQQPAQDLGVLVGSAVQTFESVAAMNTAIAGGTVADGTMCCVQQSIVLADTTSY